MIKRELDMQRLREALRTSRVVALLGPRQSGKTTLARQIVPANSPNYFDLEDPTQLSLLNDPMSALSPLRGIVVIDEVQHRPELFQVLRVLADRVPLRAKFLVLGSASHDLLRQTSESLAGRIATVRLEGLRIADLGEKSLHRHWLRGSYPVSYRPRAEQKSVDWRRQFIQTYFERDMPGLGVTIAPLALRRFWYMLAHFHGQMWNAAELARALAVNESTVRRYLDLLSGVFMVRQLPPWFENIGKRQVKAPKVYIRDSGLFHTLLDIKSRRELELHAKVGASWEGYVIEEILKELDPFQAYFWATQTGAELDLLLFGRGGRRIGIECKRSEAPTVTPSMRIAIQDLKLEELHVVYPGKNVYSLGPKITASPLLPLLKLLDKDR
jgi:uncharacterized protein